jgi:hypothetical protein
MRGNLSTVGGVIGGLLVALLLLPISVGGTGSSLFWLLFGLLALALIAAVFFAITHRHPQH